ncbi:MAG: type 4a pilus biogenesis protein PilO [Patescibacteria group bacterium]
MIGTNEKEIMFKTPSKIPTLVAMLLIVGSVAFYILYTKNISAELNTAQANLTDKTVELAEKTKQFDEISSAEESLDLTNEVARNDILKKVPSKMQQDQVITDIIDISEENGIKLASIGFSRSNSSDAKVSSLNVTASFEGNYLNLTDFLEAIEENARLFKVNSISVQINKLDLSDVERAFFTLNIETFYQN